MFINLKNNFLFFFLIIISFFCKNLYAKENFQIFKVVPGTNINAYKTKLKNGMTLIVVPDFRNPAATMHFYLKAGSDVEKLKSTGLAHFFEHMMFRKTAVTDEGNYDRVLSSVGGIGNAGTSNSFVTYYSTFPGPAIDIMMDLESQRFTNLSLEDPYFSTEKGAVVSERRMRVENNPIARGQEVLRSIIERETPLQWMTIGDKNDVENLTITEAHKFYKNFYTPDNTLLVVGGPFEPDHIYNLVNEHFGHWKSQKIKHEINYPKNYLTRDLGKKFICSEAVATQNYRFIYPSSDKSLKTSIYADLFEIALDDHPEGPFSYRLLKDNKASSFGIYKTYWETYSNPIVIDFNLTENQNLNDVKNEWDTRVKEILNAPFDIKNLKQAQKRAKVDSAQIVEKMSNIIRVVTHNAFFFNNPALLNDEERLLKELDIPTFLKWAHNTFSDGKYIIQGIVPNGKAKPCKDFGLNDAQ